MWCCLGEQGQKLRSWQCQKYSFVLGGDNGTGGGMVTREEKSKEEVVCGLLLSVTDALSIAPPLFVKIGIATSYCSTLSLQSNTL